MRVKMISPAKSAVEGADRRSIKYSLFPPLGLATLAGYLDPDDEVTLQDEHVESLDRDDTPDLVVIEDTSRLRVGPTDTGSLPLARRLCMFGGSSPHQPAAGGSVACRQRVLWPRRRHLAGFPGRLPRRSPGPAAPIRGANPARTASAEGRLLSADWDLYDTRHAVFLPAKMSPKQLEEGHRGAYRDFYSWANIWRAARACGDTRQRARHVAYTAGWRKLEPVWDVAIRTCHVHRFLPLLEAVLDQPSPHASAWRAAAAWVGPSLSGRFPVRSVR